MLRHHIPQAGRCRYGVCGSRGCPPALRPRQRSRRRWLIRGSWVPVVSLPSENVPAPPSPNWTLESGSLSTPGPPEVTPHPCTRSSTGRAPLQHGARHARSGPETAHRTAPPDPCPRPRPLGPTAGATAGGNGQYLCRSTGFTCRRLPPQDGRLLGQHPEPERYRPAGSDPFSGHPPTGGRYAPHPAPKQGVSAAWRACGAGLPHPPPRVRRISLT